MKETKKTQSPMAWVLGQTGDHGGQYVLSVVLAVIGVAFSLAPSTWSRIHFSLVAEK